jgi:DNA (cytosine-5)-methyltransferase 1
MECDFESIKDGLTRAGYHVHWSLLNARNFGLPQNRERIFLVGFKRDVGHFEFPAGGPAAANIAELLEREVPERYYLSAEGYETIRKRRLEQADISNNYGYHFIRDGFAATLLANPDKRKDNILIDAEGRMRFLTPREYARLQGFPDDFRLPSDACECDEKLMRSNDNKAYRQVGNSVPVAVVSEIAKRVVAALRKTDRVESASR